MSFSSRRVVAAVAALVALAGGGTALAVTRGGSPSASPAPRVSSTPSTSAGAPSVAATPSPTAPSPSPSPSVPAGGWLSGLWTGGQPSPERLAAFAQWRGRPVDTVTVYPAYETWDQMKASSFSTELFTGFDGRLAYGLPLLPSRPGSGTLDSVAAGDHDDAFEAIADLLVQHNRGDAFVRIGLEANGDWFPWGIDKRGNDPASFRAAFRHVAQLLRARLPNVTIVFDIACGRVYDGRDGRLSSLIDPYPGDDVVDVVGCDTYDRYTRISRTAAAFATNLAPSDAVGLKDVVDFARAHGKRWAVPEWSVVGRNQSGGGDNPLFITQMFAFFTANSRDLAFENYFNEPEDSLGSSIWEQVQNPKASAEYRKLWRLPG